jgi:hypothetical protein
MQNALKTAGNRAKTILISKLPNCQIAKLPNQVLNILLTRVALAVLPTNT